MSNKIFVKPADPSLKIRMPERDMKYLENEGEEVPNNPYWRSRISDGDVIVLDKKSIAVSQNIKPPKKEGDTL